MDFDSLSDALGGIPHMTREQGRKIFDHLQQSGAQNALEIGTAHGVGAAYMAGAGVQVVSVDHSRAGYQPGPEEVLRRAGVSDRVTLVRREDSNYNWWLLEQLEAGATFDFCYLDGSHNFTMDGLAVILIEKMLTRGGWLLMDDLPWIASVRPDAVFDARDPHSLAMTLSDHELSRPHMQAVFDRIVREHPSFRETRQDGEWGWARKDPEAAPRHEVSHRGWRDYASAIRRRIQSRG